MVAMAVPLLRAGGEANKIILTPGGRYLHMPCCGNSQHCKNIHEKDYLTKMTAGLTELRGRIRDKINLYNIKHVSVVQFRRLIDDDLREEEIWGEDPIHHTPRGFSEAAKGLRRLLRSRRGEEQVIRSSRPAFEKQRLDLTKARAPWIRRGGLNEAMRSEPPRGKKGGWPHPRGHGGNQHLGHGSSGRYNWQGKFNSGRGSGRGSGSGRGRWY